MNQKYLRRIQFKLASLLAISFLFAEIAGAQANFFESAKGDLIAGFRKGSPADEIESNDMVVYLGNITNFIGLTVGTTINITNYGNTQLTNMCSVDNTLANLKWSVFSTFTQIGINGPWVTPVGSFPNATTWLTQPRTSFGTQSTPPTRFGVSTDLRADILGVSSGANTIGNDNGTSNQFNNIYLVTEPKSYDTGSSSGTYSSLVSDSFTPDNGTFGANVPWDIENITPSPFSTPIRSDLFQMVPTGAKDPNTGTTSGPGYYLGYFTMNTDGTMTFTRDKTVSNPQPAPPALSVSSSESSPGAGVTQVTSVISFFTTNAATYTLYYTNSSGLTTPVTSWPSVSTTITGDNLMHSFTNISTDPNRFYRVGAQ